MDSMDFFYQGKCNFIFIKILTKLLALNEIQQSISKVSEGPVLNELSHCQKNENSPGFVNALIHFKPWHLPTYRG